MAKIAFSMFNRPTKAGLYYVMIKLPFRLSVADFRLHEGNIELPDHDGVETGLFVWDDAGTERTLSFDAAKAHVERSVLIPSVRWVKKVAMIGKGGIVEAYAYYMYLKEPPPTLPGLSSASETLFDEDGQFLVERDAAGRSFTAFQASSLGDWQTPAASVLIGLAAVAGGALLLGLFSAGLLTVGWLVALGLLLGVATPVGIYFVQVTADPQRSKSLLEQAKSTAAKAVDTVSSAAKWTAGILGLILGIKVLELLD